MPKGEDGNSRRPKNSFKPNETLSKTSSQFQSVQLIGPATPSNAITASHAIGSFDVPRSLEVSAEASPDHGSSKDESENIDLYRRQLSKTMNQAIRELDRLMEEAVKLAEVSSPATQNHERLSSGEQWLESGINRPSHGIATRIRRYLEQASPLDDGSSPERMIIPVPESAVGPLQEKETKLSRTRRTVAQSTPPNIGRPPPRLQPPEIGPRTTSAGQGHANSGSRKGHSPPGLWLNDTEIQDWQDDEEKQSLTHSVGASHEGHFSQMFGIDSRHVSIDLGRPSSSPRYLVDLDGVQHVDLPERAGELDVHSTRHHAPVARNWAQSRKRLAAWISCINTACLGIILGIYSGEVPAIQYVIVDVDREMILGNVCLYFGLAVPTMVFWPLPLFHGRKPYVLAALALSLCLQIPQGLIVSAFRSPEVRRYRILFLLSRGLLGFFFGFANLNGLATLLDCFGASLQSNNSHHLANRYDVRRHGGGMGVWLAIWSWCNLGPIGLGFFLGTTIISWSTVDWGFWITLMLLMLVILLNLIAPEVRRSAFRRTIKEVL